MADSKELSVDRLEDDGGIDLGGVLLPLHERWKTVLGSALLVGVVGLGASYAIADKFTANCVFLPPQQQQQGGSALALASLGALSGLVGAAKNPPDQYIALMQSATVFDRIIDKFKLRALYDVRFMVDARKKLLERTRISAGKKDNLITVEYTDTDPIRAAAVANQFVEELRALTNGLAITEAQQRREFFENLLAQTRDKLAAAQTALEGSGITAGAINTEPRSAAQAYAQLQAQLTAAEVKLQVIRTSLADTAPETRRVQETVDALRAQLAKIENRDRGQNTSGEYINRYREFKYQETLFDLFARQYESARVDESHEGALIQVVDAAKPPERKSSPKHALYGIVATLAGLLVSAAVITVRGRSAARTGGSRQR